MVNYSNIYNWPITLILRLDVPVNIKFNFINRGNTTLDQLTLIDTFPDDILTADILNINPGSKFEVTVSGNLLIFTLKAGQTIGINEYVYITIPFDVLPGAVPNTVFTNKVFADFNTIFPQDTAYDHCGNEIIIPSASGESYTSLISKVAEPDSKGSIFKCQLSTGSVNIGDQKEFIIYVINNGSEDLNTIVKDYLADNNLDDITDISYYSGTVALPDIISCNFKYADKLADSLSSGYLAEFDTLDAWNVTVPANCNFGEFNVLAIKFKATQLPAISGSNCARLLYNNVSSCTYYSIYKLGRLEVSKYLNSALGLTDWDTLQTMAANNIFEYKIVVTNTGSVATIDTLEIHDTLPDCAEGISAKINGVSVPLDDVYYFNQPLQPGDSIVLIIEAEYQGGLEDCINKASVKGRTNMSSNPLTPLSNNAIIKADMKDPCLAVGIIIDTSYVIKGEKIDQCCFDLYYENEYSPSGIFTHIGYDILTTPAITTVPLGGFGQVSLYYPPKFYSAYKNLYTVYIPGTTSPQPFLKICFDHTETTGDSITVLFDWLGADSSVICTTTVGLKCGSVGSPGGMRQLLATREQSIESPKVLLYPNPVNNTLMVLVNSEAETGFFRIVSADGRLVFNKPLDLNLHRTGIDVKSLLPGIYILNITLSTGENTVLKFVKQ